ncbi:conjugal transfer protein [Escherichia coli]|uniref:TrbM/KikA/MpfK family conjugal transfer protein n=1 Tax=Klebsiella pneumoniae TaxID=573 RepID=UPI00175A8219|nr:TrbM/KikA/MpfK family conjugal transfer protein [Klebsiella pneumoniae]EGI4400603.1 conjugal transfer protein [Escherichia coli]EHL5992550.1 conjugal transfer protein [Escherichia coli]EHL9236288.1 conjugal transfer protein [Escherichia coli]ELW7758885.1 conjugal transfer protein [Escherichia coli]MCU9727493.1 TrbM/KikA/MpfK family conjugal transfer protein [Escherichia coli]
MNKSLLLPFIMAAGFSIPVYAVELTPEQNLSCSALLCLSSSEGRGESECLPSLDAYFSISAKKMSDTIKERKDFLKICPASSEPGMPDLVDSISQGAGRCDADDLNRNLIETRIAEVNCKRYRIHGDYDCETEVQYRIKSKLPSYCQIYIDNAYTDIGLHYSGSPIWQNKKDFSKSPSGKWIN